VNLITDSLPALALGMDPPDPGLMGRAPRRRSEGIVNLPMALDIALVGAVIGLGTLGIFWYLHAARPEAIDYARTMAFASLVIYQMWNVINCKAGDRSALSPAAFNNVYVWAAIVVSIALLAGIMYVPFLRGLFGIVALTAQDWALVLAWTSVVLIVAELRKAAARLARKTGRRGLSRR
jgi:P-type Ca2+ transporter type 2C